MEDETRINIPARREYRVGRPHHRTTMLTTTRKEFDRVKNMADDEEVMIQFPNDIISSAKGGSSVAHHSVRRIDLIRRQINGGFTKVNVRCEQGFHIPCFIVSSVTGESDSCSGYVWVSKSCRRKTNV